MAKAFRWVDHSINQAGQPRPVKHPGRVLQCDHCAGRRFYLFILQGHEHAHAQCAGCGNVACLSPDECEREGPAGEAPAGG